MRSRLDDRQVARVRRVVWRALPWILLVSLLGNIGMTLKYHSGTSHSLRVSESSDLADLIDTTYPLMRQSYEMYADLSRVAGDSTIVLPVDHPLDPGLLRFLAGMTVQVRDIQSEVDRTALPSPAAAGRVLVGATVVRYSIIAGEGGDVFWLGRDGDGLIVIPESVLEVPGGGA